MKGYRYLRNMANTLEYGRLMTRGKLLVETAVLLLLVGVNGGAAAWGQTGSQTPLRDPNLQVPVFKAGIDLVRIAAVVRDRKGRFVQDLTVRDFEVLVSILYAHTFHAPEERKGNKVQFSIHTVR